MSMKSYTFAAVVMFLVGWGLLIWAVAAGNTTTAVAGAAYFSVGALVIHDLNHTYSAGTLMTMIKGGNKGAGPSARRAIGFTMEK